MAPKTVFKPNKPKKAAPVADLIESAATSTAASSQTSASASPTPTTPAGPARRQLGNNPTAATSSSNTAPAVRKPSVGADGKTKFVPSMRKKGKVIDNDDVKLEENAFASGSKPRPKSKVVGARAPRVRQEIQMTASGAFGQGPRVSGNTKKGTSGGNGGAPGTFQDAHDLDLESDLETESWSGHNGIKDDEEQDMKVDNDFVVRAKKLNSIQQEDDMAPMVLPIDPKVARLAMKRREERSQSRKKSAEVMVVVKDEPVDYEMDTVTSGTTTPAQDTRSSYRGETADAVIIEEPDEDFEDAKPFTAPPEMVDITEDFFLEQGHAAQLYMFQFPRQFPHFNEEISAPSDSIKKENGRDVKPKINDATPEWGRSGDRKEKSSRWQSVQGQIGWLRTHKSGRVTMKIRGDLTFEVLPAATPTFLQEIVVLDHDISLVPKPAGTPQDDFRQPNRSLLTIGQTNKKYVIVPTVEHLLAEVKLEEDADLAVRLAAKAARDALKAAKKEEN